MGYGLWHCLDNPVLVTLSKRLPTEFGILINWRAALLLPVFKAICVPFLLLLRASEKKSLAFRLSLSFIKDTTICLSVALQDP